MAIIQQPESTTADHLNATTVSFLPSSNRRLLLIIAPDQRTLDSLLLRASIYTEDSKFKSVYLSQHEFAVAKSQKKFNYKGHNLPFTKLLTFLNLSISNTDTTLGETHLTRQLPKLKLVHDAPQKKRQTYLTCVNPDVYVIGWICGDVATLEHELYHAWYFTDRANYQALCASTFASLNQTLRLQVRAYLQGCGYCQDVFLDEFQAHLGCNDPMVLGHRGMLLMQPARLVLRQCIMDGGGGMWFDKLEQVANGQF